MYDIIDILTEFLCTKTLKISRTNIFKRFYEENLFWYYRKPFNIWHHNETIQTSLLSATFEVQWTPGC